VKSLTFIPALLLRSPLYSFADYSPTKLKYLLHDPHFILGVYLASPTLFKIIEKTNFDAALLNKSQQLSLLKYINRMHYRPTPFGAFSSFSITQWGNADSLHLGGLSDVKLYTDWDQEVILKLSLAYITEHWRETWLKANHTLYIVKDEYRFVRTHFNFEKKTISFSLEALSIDHILEQVLKLVEQPINGEQLLEAICNQFDLNIDEAHDYIFFLIDHQFLLSDLHPSVIGAGKQYSFPGRPLQNDFSITTLPKLRLSENTLQAEFSHQQLDLPQHTFYINTKRPISGNLDNKYQGQLMQALEFLSQALPVQLPSALKTFIDAFKTRYDQEEIPLLQALDPEIGIGYSDLAVKISSSALITDLNFSSQASMPNNLNWLAIHRIILDKWNNAIGRVPEIILDTNDLEIIGQPQNKAVLPPSIAVMFRVLDEHILLESAGGVTGAALIGRFAAFDDEIKTIANEIISDELAINPNVIFAEIGQLSGMHIDNVNRRAHLYNYEIPINVSSTLPPENQILLNDLYLSINQDRLLIRCKKLGKEIIPRLTSAYNYIHNDLALFRFLCDMQHQDLQSNLSFDLENFFPGLSFYPRVKVGSVIISPAKWVLNESEIINLSKSTSGFQTFSAQKKWPQYVAISKNDQQLIFNISNNIEIELLLACIQGSKTAQIQEYLLPNQQLVTDNDGKPMVNQFVAFLKNSVPSYNPTVLLPNNSTTDVERTYPLGSEWIYLKIYCHEQSANNVITKDLIPILEAYAGIINKWFFIRYQDPKSHIRLRMQVRKSAIGQILTKLNNRLGDSIKHKVIHEYKSDVYRREIERYSPLLIDVVESVFHSSSELVCKYILNIESTLCHVDYHSLALVSTRDIIYLFSDFIGDGLSFTDSVSKSLYQEFSQDKSLKISLDQKYRLMRDEIAKLLTNTAYYHQLNLQDQYAALVASCITLKTKAKALSQERKINLVADIIHMHLNRIFFEHPRKQELSVYHMLNKYFTGQIATKRTQFVLENY
jgi:thiopeptide-type bacteriocin biosynthesis protein